MKMFDGNPVGVRSRYLAEEKAHTDELFAKAAGFKTPITKPVASFKAPSVSTSAAKPKAVAAKPAGALPSSGERLKALKENMAANIGATAPSSGAPAAVGTVGKADRLRRKGKFQRSKPSTVAKAMLPGGVYKPTSLLTAAERSAVRHQNATRGMRRPDPLHTRGAAAHDSEANQMLRQMREDQKGAEASAHPHIRFHPRVDQDTRRRVLALAPKRLKGGPIVVDHNPRRIGGIFDAQPEGYVRAGSKRVPATLHLKDHRSDSHTIAHELTHANRKSLNTGRLQRIVADPKKLGREEGRADAGAARQGFHQNPPYGAASYTDFAAIERGKHKRMSLERFGHKLMSDRSGKIAGMDYGQYNAVRNKMGQPVKGLTPNSKKMLTDIRRTKRNQQTVRVLTHPATPSAVFAASLPFATHKQRKQEAARKAKSSAAYQQRKARRVSKAEPLKTSVSEDDARKLVDRHGLKGPLPKGLSREQKMAAYEARYVSAGGKKAERWQHRAQVADKVKTGGLAVATAGGAGWLATRGKAGKAISPAFKHHAETVAGAGATAGGAGELYAGHARRKRSSYASAPAGVARSALTRMRDYTP